MEVYEREEGSASSITGFLESDHRRIDLLLEAALLAWQEDGKVQVQRSLDAFVLGLRHHIRMEEEILFPAVERKGVPMPGPTHVMRMEHRDMEDLMQTLQNSVEPLPDAVDDLRGMLAMHNRKEEDILYPLCDRLLGPDVPGIIERMSRLR